MDGEESRSSTEESVLSNMDDDEDIDALGIEEIRRRPDGKRMEKDNSKRSAEAASLKEKINAMVKSKKTWMVKTLQTKIAMAEKKNQQK